LSIERKARDREHAPAELVRIECGCEKCRRDTAPLEGFDLIGHQ
jgi:hypothetical protein